jgi:hypothetical protein
MITDTRQQLAVLLAAARQAYDAGKLTVHVSGRTINYKSREQMKGALATLEAELGIC